MNMRILCMNLNNYLHGGLKEKENGISHQVMKMDLLCITARGPSLCEFHGGTTSREFSHLWQFALIAKHHRSGKEGGVSCTLKRQNFSSLQ